MLKNIRLTAGRGSTGDLPVMLTIAGDTKGRAWDIGGKKDASHCDLEKSMKVNPLYPTNVRSTCSPVKNLFLALAFIFFAFTDTFCGEPREGLSSYQGRGGDFTNEQIVNAIKLAENSVKYPYGIKSVKCSGEKECREICMRSVRNSRARWEKAGKPEDLITFMSRRYCPINAKDDPNGLNKHWISNVRFFLERGKK